jgi:hypothetical protein
VPNPQYFERPVLSSEYQARLLSQSHKEAQFARRCDHIGLRCDNHIELAVQPRSVNDWEIKTTNA